MQRERRIGMTAFWSLSWVSPYLEPTMYNAHCAVEKNDQFTMTFDHTLTGLVVHARRWSQDGVAHKKTGVLPLNILQSAITVVLFGHPSQGHSFCKAQCSGSMTSLVNSNPRHASRYHLVVSQHGLPQGRRNVLRHTHRLKVPRPKRDVPQSTLSIFSNHLYAS